MFVSCEFMTNLVTTQIDGLDTLLELAAIKFVSNFSEVGNKLDLHKFSLLFCAKFQLFRENQFFRSSLSLFSHYLKNFNLRKHFFNIRRLLTLTNNFWKWMIHISSHSLIF